VEIKLIPDVLVLVLERVSVLESFANLNIEKIRSRKSNFRKHFSALGRRCIIL
jgi:hypothetical protein